MRELPWGKTYPQRVIDHFEARDRALRRLRRAQGCTATARLRAYAPAPSSVGRSRYSMDVPDSEPEMVTTP